jgi:hypothetical protein
LWRALTAIDGADEGSSVFAEDDTSPALWVNGKQITNFRSAGVIEVRLTKKRISAERARLKADPRVELRKNPSDWLQVRYSRPADIPFVRELVEIAVDAHRPASGRTSKPPPSGADLARRRRFH